jgi:short-subunit dehydrogenase
MDLTGLTALVTGSNRGIGRAVAEELARRPLGLLLCGARTPGGTPSPGAPAGGAAEIREVALDLSSRESIETGAAALPHVDLLVNNAGRMTGGLLEEQDTEDIYAMFQANLVGLVHLTKLLLPGMVERGRGKVVNNASISGYAWFPAATTYAASKTGVVAFSESLRRELRGTGVSVLHLVTPGIDTDMLDATREVYGRHMAADSWDDQSPDEWAAKIVRAIERDDHVLGPGGRLALAKLASRGPASLLDAISERMFTREPR